MMTGRWTVLMALLAQGLLMSPACLVRCVASNGDECVELAGQVCRCCEHEVSDREQPGVACCSAHHHAPDDGDSETMWTSRTECGCFHSPWDFMRFSIENCARQTSEDFETSKVSAFPITQLFSGMRISPQTPAKSLTAEQLSAGGYAAR